MRCSCKVCGPEVWMVQAESALLGCVCPECGYRCSDCLGTDTVVPRDRIAALALDPRFSPESLRAVFSPPDGDEDGGWDWEEEGGYER